MRRDKQPVLVIQIKHILLTHPIAGKETNMIWNLGSLVVLGGIAGWLGSIVLGRNKEMGCWANIGIGILGAIIVGLVMSLIFPSAPDIGGVNLYSIVLGTLGAVLLLLVTGWYRGRAE